MKDIKIIIATHKKYKMPDNNIYIPVQVGAEGKEALGYQPDNDGENISTKNPYFCELTGLYWAWKNLKNEYLGIVHYRRFFSTKKHISKKNNEKYKSILNEKEVSKILSNTNVILPKKRKYYIENLYGHYQHTMYVEPLEETRKIIEQKYPTYLKEFDKLHTRTSAHMFNMFIMQRETLDKYCTWLFDILFELEKRINITKYDSFHARFFGRISELLLDVWINKNNIKYKEVRLIDIEDINWMYKIKSFLRAKFLGEKYEKSF